MLDTPGDRLLHARQFVAKNRKDFCEKHDISASTLSQVEGGFMDLSEKFSRKIVDALKTEGLLCSVEWIKTGVGNPPESLESLSKKIQPNQPVPEHADEERIALMESMTFENLNKDSIVMAFPYNDMFNEFKMGDLIGGIKVKKDFNNFFGKKIIAQLEDKTTWVGFLGKGSHDTVFSIIPFNLHEGGNVLYDASVETIFEVIWHRKRLY